MGETLVAEQPPQNQERAINRELRARTDTTTWLAEVLNGSMRTRFEFSNNGYELFGEDGEALRTIFDNAIDDARTLKSELSFETRRRLIEREELGDMEAMARGELVDEAGNRVNTIVVPSDFPAELAEAHKDIGGYNVRRKPTMLRIITLEPDGSISITTQSLDRSDRQALESIYHALGRQPEPGELLGQRIYLSLSNNHQTKLADNLTQVYDDSLTQRFGGKWHAGIKQSLYKNSTGTYEFACAQRDLVDWFTNQKLANPTAAEKYRYDLAATAKARYERRNNPYEGRFMPGTKTIPSVVTYRSVVGGLGLEQEMRREGQKAAEKGEIFSGCGGSVEKKASAYSQTANYKLVSNYQIATKYQLSELGYGNTTASDKYGSLTFTCTHGHDNTRERNELKDKCCVEGCTGKVKC
jgi:hypothetical protein